MSNPIVSHKTFYSKYKKLFQEFFVHFRGRGKATYVNHIKFTCKETINLCMYYLFLTVSQSSRNFFTPASVRGCWIICMMTLYGTVAICAPNFAA